MNIDPRGRWAGAEVVCIASGPSLTAEDCITVGVWKAWGGNRRVIAVNNSFLRAPWADVLYSGDRPWWDEYERRCRSDWPMFHGERWSQSADAKRRHGTNWVRSEPGEGLSADRIHNGGNSGYQALQLAVLFGAKRVILLGYDMQKMGGRAHWHEDHPAGLGNGTRHDIWAERFDRLAPKLAAVGVVVFNATRQTALARYPRISLEAALSRQER